MPVSSKASLKCWVGGWVSRNADAGARSFLVSGFWFLVSGFSFLVSRFWFLVSGWSWQKPETQYGGRKGGAMEMEVKEVEPFLKVGTVVVFHLDPSREWGPRFRTVIRGWENPAYIILDRPRENERLVPMRKGMPCVVRLLRDGEACAFSSAVLDWEDKRGCCWCRIAWPDSALVVAFRRDMRTRVSLPCMIVMNEGGSVAGTICDLSIGGLSIKTEAALRFGSEIGVSFTLPGEVLIVDAQAIVRSTRRNEQEEMIAGCEFSPGQNRLQSEIALFETVTLARNSDETPPPARVLIIDPNALNGESLIDEFRKWGCQAFTASNTVEAFSRLYVLRPRVVVVNQRNPDLPGLEIFRLIRANHAFASTPVFLYGAEGSDATQEAMQAGVRGCFPECETPADIATAIYRAVIKPDQRLPYDVQEP